MRQSVLNDEVNQKLEEFMQMNRLPIKFVRIGEGLYTFGSKKIFVKVLNERLVIRIGGGYMFIEQFIKMHANHELNKLKNMKENEIKDIEPNYELPPDEGTYVDGNNPETQRETIIKEIENSEFADLTIVARPSPRKKRFDKPITSGFSSPDGKLAIDRLSGINSHRGERSTERNQERQTASELAPLTEPFSLALPAESEHNTLAKECTDKKTRKKQNFYYDISPNSQQKSSGKKSVTTRLSQDHSQNRISTEPTQRDDKLSVQRSSARKKTTPNCGSNSTSPFSKTCPTHRAPRAALKERDRENINRSSNTNR